MINSVSPQVPSSSPSTIKLKSPITLFKEAWVVYKRRFKVLIGIQLSVYIPILVIIAIADTGVFFKDRVSLSVLFTALVFFVGTILTFIIQLWGQASILFALKDETEEIGVTTSFRNAAKKIVPLSWLMFLGGIVAGGGFLFLVIPGILFTVWFSLALYVLVDEDVRGMNALLKSREYVRGRFWQMTGRLFLPGILAIFLHFAIGATLDALIGNAGSIFSQFIEQASVYLLNVFLAPLLVIYGFLLYRSAREIKGDFQFEPKRGTKALYLLAGIAGIGIITTLFLGSILTPFLKPAPSSPSPFLPKPLNSSSPY